MEAPPSDLPAAHSMDTEWFAIDGLGHVAVFESGEGGGVPEAHFGAWHAQSEWAELLHEMLSLAAPGSIRFVADGVFDGEDERRWERGQLFTDARALADSNQWEDTALLELAAPQDPALLEGWLGTAHVLGCVQPLVYARQCSGQTIAALWDELGVVRALLQPPMLPSRFGMFEYVNEDYSGAPYQRERKPMGAPLRVEALGTGVRRRLEEVRLAEVDFRRAGRVQPFEHLPSSIWGSRWIGTDGSEHDVG